MTSRQTGNATSPPWPARPASPAQRSTAPTRTYPHLKEEFEHRLAALRASGTAPDPRDAQITRLKAHNDELRRKLADRDAVIRDLEQFRTLALSRIAAQHDEISRLRREARQAARIRRLPSATAKEPA